MSEQLHNQAHPHLKFKDQQHHGAYSVPKSTGVSAKKNIKRNNSHFKKEIDTTSTNFKDFATKSSARGEAYNFTEQQFNRNQKFMSGSYFRNTKSQKKQKVTKQQLYLGMQQQQTLHQNNMSLQQLQMLGASQHHQSQQQFQTAPNQNGLPPTNPSSGKLPVNMINTQRQISGADQISNMNLYQTFQQRQNSQQSLSQVSKGSTDQISKEQTRRRMVALAQAQQQQIIAAATTRHHSREVLQNSDQMMEIEMIRRSSGDLSDNQATIQNTNDRTNSKFDKTRMNLTQPLSLNSQYNASQGTISTQNQTRNLVQQVVFNNSQMINNQKIHTSGEVTAAHSPRKHGFVNEVMPIQSARQVLSQESMQQRGKVQRHISGHTQRRLNHNQPNQKQQNGYLTNGSNFGQAADTHSQHGLQSYNRRRQAQNEKDYEGDCNQIPIGLQYLSTHNLTSRGLQNNTNSFSKSKKSGDIHKVSGTILNNSQKTLRTLQQNNQFDTQFQEHTSSQAYLHPAQAFDDDLPLSNVIYHPHPLNNNVPQLSQMQMNIITKQQFNQNQIIPDSTRALSQRPSQGQMNNRISRKNLKPIGKKKGPQQTSQIHLNLMFKNSKKNQQQQYSNKQSNANSQSIIPQLHPQHADQSASGSRERAVVGATYNTHNPQSQFQSGISSSNITTKNTQFKFKTPASGTRAVQAFDASSMNSGGRRPIVVRQNNFVSQNNYHSGGMPRNKEQQHSQINIQQKQNMIYASEKRTDPKLLVGEHTGISVKSKMVHSTDLLNQEGVISDSVGQSGVGMSAMESAFDKSRSDQTGPNQHLDQSKSINGPLMPLNDTGDMVDSDSFKAQPALTARQSKEFKSFKDFSANQTANSSHIKLIKVNKSKTKLVDSAIRSQLQKQLEGGAFNSIANEEQADPQFSRNFEQQAASVYIQQKQAKIKQILGVNNNKTVNVQKQSKMSSSLVSQHTLNNEGKKVALSKKDDLKSSQSKPVFNIQQTKQSKGGPRDMRFVKVKLCTQKITRENSLETDAQNQIDSANTTTVYFQNKLGPQTCESNKTHTSIPKSNFSQGKIPVQVHQMTGTSRGVVSMAHSFKTQNSSQPPINIQKVNAVNVKEFNGKQSTKSLKRGEIFKKQQNNKAITETSNDGNANEHSQVSLSNGVNNLKLLQEIAETKSQDSCFDNMSASLRTSAALKSSKEAINPVRIENQLSEQKQNFRDQNETGGESKEITTGEKYMTQSEMENAMPLSREEENMQNKMSILNPISEEEGGIREIDQTKVNQKQKCETTMAKTQQLQTSFKHNKKTQQGKIDDEKMANGLFSTAFSQNSVVSRQEVPPLPTTPQNILKFYINQLTDYEKGEVFDYEMIYFLGNNKKDKVDANLKDYKEPLDESKSSKEDTNKEQLFNHNYGYDDEKGDYKIVTGDHIGYRYEITEFLGKGSFGTALKCIDHKDNKKEVAVKIVKNKKKYYYQASVELKILQYLKQHDVDDIMNVIHIDDYVIFRKHLCMSFELLSMNLFEFLKINDFSGFDHNLIRRFAIQLLYALKYLKQLEIIHCDLKPENILLKEENKSGIKIIDFGSSTFIDEKVYTYIQSRFYRAPEIMLGIPYTTAIDMWSLGCIMAELYIGYPIFPGESENDQMSRIMEMRDVPSEEVLETSERKMKFFTVDKDKKKLEPIMLENSRGKLRKPNGKPLDYVIGDEDPDFNDFVIKCLDWNPQTRLTPDDALKHVWVLKGLPPQVLIHHQKMHNIATPELPETVKVARDEFLIEQQREQMLLLQQQQRTSNGQRVGKKASEAKRDISQNPDQQRPQAQLKTPRSALKDQPKEKQFSTTTKNEASEKQNQSSKINLSVKKGTFNQTQQIPTEKQKAI